MVLATIVLNVVGVTYFVHVPWSDWRTGTGLNIADNLLLAGYALLHRDRLMGRLILFGLIVGFVELPADAWLVDVSRSLDYSPGGGWRIWRSPAWMPFAWQVVAVQFGYLGLRLFEWIGWPGLIVNGLLGAVNIPYYEETARKIHWWEYHDAVMFRGSHTPWAIILGEFFIAISLGWFARWLRRPNLGTTVAAGVLAGTSIFVFYVASEWAVNHLMH